MSTGLFIIELLLTVALIGGLILSAELGAAAARRASRRRGTTDSAASGHIAAVQAAMLGLLGLLLGFSFAGASGRFIERQDFITREASAIGTAYLRADLLPEPTRLELRSLLRSYADERFELFQEGYDGDPQAVHDRLTAAQPMIWRTAVQGVGAAPHFAVPVLAPLNELFDLHTARGMAAGRHLPAPVLVLLIACAALSVFVVGYGSGLCTQPRRMFNLALILLISAALWITVDLDHPRHGFIALSDQPLRELISSMKQ